MAAVASLVSMADCLSDYQQANGGIPLQREGEGVELGRMNRKWRDFDNIASVMTWQEMHWCLASCSCSLSQPCHQYSAMARTQAQVNLAGK